MKGYNVVSRTDEDGEGHEIYVERGAGLWGTGIVFQSERLADATVKAIRDNLAADRRDHPDVAFLDATEFEAMEMSDYLAVTGTDLNDAEWAAVVAVTEHPDVAHTVVDGRNFEGILTMSFTAIADAGPLPYEYLYVYDNGHVASAMTNHPESFETFEAMVEDTRSAS